MIDQGPTPEPHRATQVVVEKGLNGWHDLRPHCRGPLSSIAVNLDIIRSPCAELKFTLISKLSFLLPILVLNGRLMGSLGNSG